jgi:hypothetical protein
MSVTGGDLIEITYNHPTLGSGVLYPKAGEDSTFDGGGFRNNDDSNGIDGGGRAIFQKNRVRWMVESTVSWEMAISNEAEKIKQLASDPVDATWTITHINGTVWQGKGQPVGDIQPNGNAATLSLKISGGGQLEKISG